MDGKPAHAAQCSKTHALTKFIDLIIEIESFEKQCAPISSMSCSYQLKQYMVNIGIDQSLSNCAMYENRCLEKSRNYTRLMENSMIN